MVLKTRKAFPKYYLFKKFKIDFFNFFTKSARITRGLFRFSVRWFKRYDYQKTYSIKNYGLRRHVRWRIYKFLTPVIIKNILFRFSFYSSFNKANLLNRRLIERLARGVIFSNKARTAFGNFIECRPISFFKNNTPVGYRFLLLNNNKKNDFSSIYN